MLRIPDYRTNRNSLRSLRNGKGKNENNFKDEDSSHMSDMRKSVLLKKKHLLLQKVKEILQWLGDNSGCHQMPERSFFIGGWQFPLCARCTGSTVGQMTAVLMALAGKLISIPVCLVSLGIMGLDWGIQEAGIKESTNRRRFITGFLGGFGLFSLYVHGLRKLLKRKR